MKKGKPKQMYNGLFREAERLTPSPGLWDRIEAKVDLRPAGQSPAESTGQAQGPGLPAHPVHPVRKARILVFPQRPWLRAAASVALAVGIVGLGVTLRHKQKQLAEMAEKAETAETAGVPADNVRADAKGAEPADQMDLVDPDLLGWHADLGEVDLEADEAEEVL